MSENVKISLIIPVYNMQKYLQQCIESVVNQTFKDFEAIFVNDGSTDDSLKILNDYAQKDSRIVVISQENQGQAKAKNNALKIIKGQFIMFLDPDDWLELTALEKAYNQIVKNKDDLVFFAVRRYFQDTGEFKKTSKLLPFRKFYNGSSFSIDEINVHFMNSGEACFKLYDRKFIENNEICFSDEMMGEDVYFYIKCLTCLNKMSVINEELYNYRAHSESITKNPSYWQDVFKVKEKTYRMVRKTNNKLIVDNYIVNLVNTFHHRFKTYSRLDKSITLQYYKRMKEFYKMLRLENDIKSIKFLDTYYFNKVLRFPYWLYKLSLAFDKIFSIRMTFSHIIINFLGIKLNIKRSR